MMGFSVIIIFALLQIHLLNAGGNPEDLSNTESTDSSNHHQRYARALPLKELFAGKNKDQSILDPNTYLELVESKTPPEDAYTFFHEEKEFYIYLTGKCNDVKLEQFEKADGKEHQFLVNKENFEDLEWKTWADIENSQTSFSPVWICKRYYIAKDESGKASLTKKKKKKQTEYLCLNNDITLETLHMESEDPVQKTPEIIDVLKQFIVVNKNCKSAKHVVKLDQGRDESSSSQKGRTHAFGVAVGGSASGTTPTSVNLGGTLNLKYDYSRSKTITTSNVDKILHSWSMEIEVPPNHSCSIEITSKTFITTFQYSGWLTRIYGNNVKSTTSVTGIHENQKVELESKNACTAEKEKVIC